MLTCQLRSCRRVETALAGEFELLRETQRQFRAKIAPWFTQSWFMHRATTKPAATRAIIELLTGIYEGQPKSTGIGGYLDLYFLGTTLARGVVNRMLGIRRFLIEEFARRHGEIIVWDVACGPCREFMGGLDRPQNGRISVTLFDSDAQALDYVQANIIQAGYDLPEMHTLCYNALRMKSAETNHKFGRCDILYSVGLCDYIPDDFLIAMLRGWRESVSDGGAVYVALKDCERYDKTKYQWLTDWYFFQRTEAECRDLFARAGYDMQGIEMTRDQTGAIMNFVSRVKCPAYVRRRRSGAAGRRDPASCAGPCPRGSSPASRELNGSDLLKPTDAAPPTRGRARFFASAARSRYHRRMKPIAATCAWA